MGGPHLRSQQSESEEHEPDREGNGRQRVGRQPLWREQLGVAQLAGGGLAGPLSPGKDTGALGPQRLGLPAGADACSVQGT